MAKPHIGIDSFTNYLSKGFPWKETWVISPSGPEDETLEFTSTEVKEAIVRLKRTDPYLHKLLAYRWLTKRTRNDIANSQYMDPSTLKRKWDVAINIIVNYLINKEAAADLDPIDIGYEEF
jgi:hypothetical protein